VRDISCVRTARTVAHADRFVTVARKLGTSEFDAPESLRTARRAGAVPKQSPWPVPLAVRGHPSSITERHPRQSVAGRKTLSLWRALGRIQAFEGALGPRSIEEGRPGLDNLGFACDSLGFYLELGLGIQNSGERNSVIRKFFLEIPETATKRVEVTPSPRPRVQTRKAQMMTQNMLIVTQGNSIVVGDHNVCSGILPFYVSGDPGKLPEKVRCTLEIEDSEGTSAKHTFTVPVAD